MGHGAGSKIPGLRVKSPKGCVNEKKGLEEVVPENILELMKKDCTRIDYWADIEQEGTK